MGSVSVPVCRILYAFPLWHPPVVDLQAVGETSPFLPKMLLLTILYHSNIKSDLSLFTYLFSVLKIKPRTSSVTRQMDGQLRRWLIQSSACCMCTRTWLETPRIHVKKLNVQHMPRIPAPGNQIPGACWPDISVKSELQRLWELMPQIRGEQWRTTPSS